MKGLLLGLILLGQVAHANTTIQVSSNGNYITGAISLPKGHAMRAILKDVLISSGKMKDLQVYTEPGTVFHSDGAINGNGATLVMIGDSFSLSLVEEKNTVSHFSNDGRRLEITGEQATVRLFEILNASTNKAVLRSQERGLYGEIRSAYVRVGSSLVSCRYTVAVDVAFCILEL